MQKARDIQAYETARAAYPAEALALLACGWLGRERAASVYGPIRFRACAKFLRAVALPDQVLQPATPSHFQRTVAHLHPAALVVWCSHAHLGCLYSFLDAGSGYLGRNSGTVGEQGHPQCL